MATPAPVVALLRRLTFWVLVAASLYHLYLVIHPFTPWSAFHTPLLDLTQVQRAAHVFLIVFAGSLLMVVKPAPHGPAKVGVGLWIYALLAAIPLWSFWMLKQPLVPTLVATLYWAVAVLPAVLPRLSRPFNLLAAALSVAPFLYLLIDFTALVNRAMLATPWDLAMSFGLVFLVLGIVQRMLGPVLPGIVLVFLLYNLFGYQIPGLLKSPGFPLDMLLGKLYAETEAGLFGIITGVSLKYLVYFTIMGSIIAAMGYGRVIANIAFRLVGGSPAAPGRATSVMAIMMGLFSGSGAADTLFVSTLNEPLFRRAGYQPLVAAGICATVGTLGYITPPVLGSIAFVMVELLGIPYTDIMIMALGPLLLVLLAVWTFNELYVRSKELPAIAPADDVHPGYLWRYGYVFLPVVLIIFMIFRGYTVNLAVTLAIFAFIVFAVVDPSIRPPLRRLGDGLADGFEHLIPIGAAVVAANVIMTMMVLTGIAPKVSELLLIVSGESLVVATVLAALFSLVLGMGVPPIATYVLTSALVSPAILQLIVAHGVPHGAALLATHMFLFYYAVLADITPPVGLSGYASASVFQTDPIKTCGYAAMVALPKYLFGFTFLISISGMALLVLPVLQTVDTGHAIAMIASRFLFTIAGIVLLAASEVGYLRQHLRPAMRWAFGISGLLLIYPETTLNMVALVIAAALYVLESRRAAPSRS